MDTKVMELFEYFADEGRAIEFVERMRWPDGPVCPHCDHRKAYHLKVKSSKRKVWKCASCRKQFSVMVGTIFEGSHIPLNKWLIAIYMMCSSKKSISANQLHRTLGITYKSAWFLCHRIRYAMEQPPLAEKLKGIVEVDETYVGGKATGMGITGRGAPKKTVVVSLIQRDGMARSFKVDNIRAQTLKGIIRENVEETAYIMTDDLGSYRGLGKEFAQHGVIRHGQKEYVRGIIHTNFAESYFSLLKRAIFGTFHHVSKGHLQRYLSEFDFRWNHRKTDDGQRTIEALKGIEGKRLTYKEPIRKLANDG